MTLSGRQLTTVLLNDYLGDYSLAMGLRPYTIYGKTNSIKRFLRWLKEKPFNPETCRAWVRYLREKGYKPESIKHEVRVLRAAIRFLTKRGFLEKDFALEIPSPKVPKSPPEVVSAELAEKIILTGTEPGPGDNCLNRQRKEEHRQALRFIVRTGLRNRELRDMKGADINLDNETFMVLGKNGRLQQMPLPKDMIEELKKRLGNDQLFDVTQETLNHCLRRGCRKLGVATKIRVHTLRHIFGASLYNNGAPIQEVCWLMRHADIRTTINTYGHFTQDQLRHTFNSRHPLIKQGLSPEEVLQMVQQAVETTGIKTDSRFKTEVETSPQGLVMRFGLM